MKTKIPKQQFDGLIDYVFAEFPEPSDAIRLKWADQFSELPFPLLMKAARKLSQCNLYGNPKISDLWRCIREIQAEDLPPSLSFSKAEALFPGNRKALLVRDAEAFADQCIPKIDGFRQYSSPEELQRANEINRAQWERVFTERLQSQQEKAKRLIDQGVKPERAIVQVIEESGVLALPDNVKRISSAALQLVHDVAQAKGAR